MKKCQVPGCNYSGFARDRNTGILYCQSHQWKRTDKKKKLSKRLNQTKSDADFYIDLWQHRVHRCNECGIGLGPEPFTYMFHHLIEKRFQNKYSCDIRHDRENIVLVCLQCHDQVSKNTDKVPTLKRMAEDQLKAYEKFRII